MSQGFANVLGYAGFLTVSYLASKIFKPKANKARADDFFPTTIATQGAYIPRLWGKRRIGCVFAWAGDRTVIPYAQGTTTSGKGSSKKKDSAKQLVYNEAGWHLLCVGPAYRLTKIWADGKVIWEGSLDSTSDPSGTSTSLGNGDEFVIYWGEVDQPVNTFLSASSRVGVASRWPYHCYVQWTQKGLGAQPHWPQMEYELEVKCEVGTVLANVSGAYIDGSGDTPVAPSGVNPAHVLAELLFEPFPHGLGLDPDDWDLAFLQDFAEEANTLRIPASVYAQDGENAQAIIAQVMQDHGLFLRFNGGPAVPADLLTNLEIYLPFDEADYLADASGNSRDVTEVGTLVDYTADGKVDGGADFPFSITDYLTRGTNDTVFDILGVASNQPVTIAFWVNPRTSTNYAVLLSKFTAPSGPGWIFIREPGVGGRVYMFWTTNPNVYSSAVPEGEWTHIVVRVDPSLTPPVRMFQDGVSVATQSSYADPSQSTNPLFVANANGIVGGGGPFDGVLDEVCFWSRSLTDAEIALLYNSGVGARLRGGIRGWQFVRLREACLADELSDGLPSYYPVPAGMIEAPLPEIECAHAEQAADRLVFQFPDESREYRQSTIAVGDDSQPFYLEHQRAQTVDMPTVVDFDAAAVIAERRSQEELGPKVRYVLTLNRGARRLLPGDRIVVSGITGTLRIVQVELLQHAGAKVTAVLDAYSVPATAYVPPDGSTGGSAGPSASPAADLAFDFFEVPAHLLGAPGSPPAIVVPRIRADADQAFADLWISPDGTTYTLTEREIEVQTGGSLLDAMLATDEWVIDQGPTFNALGVDIAEVEDLSSDLPAWRRGKQMALIGTELFFLQKVTLISGTTYRLDGLIRARFDTQRAAHSIADKVYIFQPTLIQFVQDAILTPGVSLRVKTQPYTGTALSLASVTAVTHTLTGKGIVPMRPTCLRVTAPVVGSLSYRTGQDVSFEWGWRSAQVPGTGAGMQGAGVAVGSSPLQSGEEFELKFLTSGDVLKKTVYQSTPTYTYDNGDLSADFGGEPASFKIQVRQVNGGYKSDAVEQTVTKIT